MNHYISIIHFLLIVTGLICVVLVVTDSVNNPLRLIAAAIGTVILLLTLTGCGTITPTDVVNSPTGQAVISALEQEALDLLNAYIKSHLGATRHSPSATEQVSAQLQARHPDQSPAIIHKAVEAAARRK